MRIIYFDIDSLRPDHLGCYGYHRNTSPNVDGIAARGVRFDNCYASDAPCLPSRTALFSGRLGIHNGVVNHGGAAAEPFLEGPLRDFQSKLGYTCWMSCLRKAKLKTVSISSFAERHSAFHIYAGFNEIYNLGNYGMETADVVSPMALEWLARHGREQNWFLHVNFWDPHTPYRTPENFGNPFENDPLPAWLTEEVRQAHWNGCGPHSAQEISGYAAKPSHYKKQPCEAATMQDVRRMFDGYDGGVRFADEHMGRIVNALADENILDETAIIISADHGENLGELNVYGDHQTADQFTCRVPLIVRWPGIGTGVGSGAKGGASDAGGTAVAGRMDSSLLYHFDFAATMMELLHQPVPENWDGRSFAEAFKAGWAAGEEKEGWRDALVLSQGAWACQRAVRWAEYIYIKTYHDAHHLYEPEMLFDLRKDPHQQKDIGAARTDLLQKGRQILDSWQRQMMSTSPGKVDPLQTALHEGGGLHTRGQLKAYLLRLRQTERGQLADELEARHGKELR